VQPGGTATSDRHSARHRSEGSGPARPGLDASTTAAPGTEPRLRARRAQPDPHNPLRHYPCRDPALSRDRSRPAAALALLLGCFITFSPDGQRVAVEGPDHQVQLWPLPKPPASMREMELRTWVALAARRSAQGNVEPIPAAEWRRLAEELRRLETAGK